MKFLLWYVFALGSFLDVSAGDKAANGNNQVPVVSEEDLELLKSLGEYPKAPLIRKIVTTSCNGNAEIRVQDEKK